MNREASAAVIREYAASLLASPIASLPAAPFLRRYGGLPPDFDLPLLDLFEVPALGTGYVGEGTVLSADAALQHRRASQETETCGDENDSLYISDTLEFRRSLVLLGEPGSGKTSLLRWHLLKRARDLLGGRRFPIPLLVSLRDYPPFLASAGRTGGGAPFLDYILSATAAFAGLAPVLREALYTGDGVLLLLDDWNALPTRHRERTRDHLHAFFHEFTGPGRPTLLLLASRLEECVDSPLPNVALRGILRPFRHGALSDLVGCWQNRLTGVDLAGENRPRISRDLEDELKRHLKTYPSLQGLFGNPFILTLFLLDAANGKTLPTRRVEAVQRLRDSLSGEAAGNPLASHAAVRDLVSVDAELQAGRLVAAVENWSKETTPPERLRMALGRIGDADAEAAARLATELLHRGSRFEGLLHQNLFLAAACMADGVPLPAAAQRSILGQLVELSSEPDIAATRIQARGLLQRCLALPLDPDAATPALHRLRHSEDPNLKYLLVQGLEFSRFCGADRLLWEWVDENDPAFSRTALRALAAGRRSPAALQRLTCSDDRSDPLLSLEQVRQVLRGPDAALEAVFRSLARRGYGVAERLAGMVRAAGADPALIYQELLDCSEGPQRIRAAQALLDSSRHAHAVAALVGLLEHPEFAVRQEAARLLLNARAPEGLMAALDECLKSDDEEEHQYAAECLLDTEFRSVGEALLLLQHLRSPQPEIRYRAASALLDTQHRAAGLFTLAAGLAIPDHRSSARCRLHWERLEPDDLAPLRELLEADDLEMRFLSAELMLKRCGDAAAERCMRALLQASDAGIRMRAAGCLREWSTDRAVMDTLVELLGSADSQIANEAAGLLIGTEAEHLLEPWGLRLVEDEKRSWRYLTSCFAFIPLTEEGANRLVPLVVRDGTNRAHFVAQILMHQGNPDLFLPALRKLLEDAHCWPPDSVPPGSRHRTAAWLYAWIAVGNGPMPAE